MTEPPMSVDTALQVVDQALASVQTTRQNHVLIAQAIDVIKKSMRELHVQG